jgi:hypothetical protein
MDVLGFQECGYSEVKYARRQLSGRLKYLEALRDQLVIRDAVLI